MQYFVPDDAKLHFEENGHCYPIIFLSNPVLWICSSLLATIDAYLTMPADFHPVTCMKSGEGIKPPLCIQEETRE